MDPIHQELLRQAVEAAKINDIDTALAKVKEVLEEDEENAKAWLLLARLTTNNDEKRIALATILQLDPENQKAKELLEKLDSQVKTRDDEEVLPGISRKLVRTIVMGLGAFVVLMLVLVVIIGQSRSASEAEQTQVAINAQRTAQAFEAQQTQVIEQQTQIAIDITATHEAINPPTPTLSPTPNLPPTPTHTPSPTFTPTPIPLPDDLVGIMVGRSGRDNRLDQEQPLVYFSLLDGSDTPIANQRGQNVTTFVGGMQFAFTRENRDTRTNEIIIVDAEGTRQTTTLTSPEAVNAFINARHPHFSVDGSRLVFVGNAFGQRTNNVYILALTGDVNGRIIVQLNNDDADYSYPALSPDGRKVVVVRNVAEGDNVGTDLVIIDVGTGVPTSLTTDRNAMIETMPRWDAQNSLVVYSARPQGQNNNELYFIDIRNPDSGQIRISSPNSDEIKATFSPDGRYLAFSSNRTGRYQVYVQNLSTNELFQMTQDENDNILGDWR